MTPDANDLLLFARIVDAGSLSAAATRYGLPKSTLSRRLSALELQLGERLLTRSTRQLLLTEFGLGILEHARRLQEEAEAVGDIAQQRQAMPRGRLKVSMPPNFEEWIAAPLFLQFASNYPNVKLELDLSPRRVDVIGEQYDLALRVADRLPDDASLVARKIVALTSALFASPAYLQRFGTPTSPAELLNHTALQLLTSSGEAQRWRLTRKDETWDGLPPGPLAANSVALLRDLATHGLGIVGLSTRIAASAVADGLLLPVLPDWQLPTTTVWAVMPSRRLIPARTRVFLEALQHVLQR
ncbi:MAG: LysR family transcriptional regulator [Uliginosibacterium sp.]|jgi:DNA-binding transcriptional LysR family regulator|nr:LysR family transcriptional regulator [Uliginosibacterium sp.]MBK9393917.1 LysR family transcriptional regulator [Uliginosibacterium sp.]